MNNPLDYLDNKKLLLNILKNIEKKILEDYRVEEDNIDGNVDMKCWYKNTPNWGKIMTFITCGTSKGGSTSAHQMCEFLDINSNGKTFFKESQNE